MASPKVNFIWISILLFGPCSSLAAPQKCTFLDPVGNVANTNVTDVPKLALEVSVATLQRNLVLIEFYYAIANLMSDLAQSRFPPSFKRIEKSTVGPNSLTIAIFPPKRREITGTLTKEQALPALACAAAFIGDTVNYRASRINVFQVYRSSKVLFATIEVSLNSHETKTVSRSRTEKWAKRIRNTISGPKPSIGSSTILERREDQSPSRLAFSHPGLTWTWIKFGAVFQTKDFLLLAILAYYSIGCTTAPFDEPSYFSIVYTGPPPVYVVYGNPEPKPDPPTVTLRTMSWATDTWVDYYYSHRELRAVTGLFVYQNKPVMVLELIQKEQYRGNLAIGQTN